MARAVALAVVLGLSLTSLAPSVGSAQDLVAVDEMRLQADRFFEQGRFCAAAERYRAIVGEQPEIFRRYAESRAACLEEDVSNSSTHDPNG